MGVFKTPKFDAAGAAAAQGQANKDAAISTQLINMVDQEGPDGSLKYTQTGERSYTDPTTGKITKLPSFLATQTLDPLGQEAKTLEKQADVGTNKLANTLLGNASGALGTPADYSEDAIKSKTDAMVNPRLNKRFADDEAALRTQLINRGMREGSEGFNDAMLSFNQGKTDAYSSDALNSRQQAIQELGLGRDRAINEIGALLGTGQIAAPNFVSTPRANIEAAPIAALMQQQAQMKQSANNAALGGMFGLGGAVLGAGAKMYAGR